MFEADSAPRELGGIREVLGSLDRATKEFTRHLEELAELGASPAGTNGASPHLEPEASTETEAADAPQPARAASAESGESAQAPPSAHPRSGAAFERTPVDLEQRMAEADAEARRYLEDAKRRTDGMVQSIVGAVEAEADARRRDAEQGIHARWRQVEEDAARFLDDARRAADGLVADRRRRISELSDTIVGLAEVLTERMMDAERIRRQFDSLVVALSETAGLLAPDPPTVAESVVASAAPATAPPAPAASETRVAAKDMWWRDRALATDPPT